jgi:hypothetical protein
VLLGLLTLAACDDAGTLPEGAEDAGHLNTVVAPDDASQSPSCCDPVIVVVPGPVEACDPYTQLDNSCDGDDGGECMSSTGSDDTDDQTLSGCSDGDAGTLPPPDTSGGGGTSPPGDGDTTCDPALHRDCEKPLTAADINTINNALMTMTRPAAEFTDSVARRECAAMEARFRQALSDGLVFRGAFDSNSENTGDGAHSGFTSAEGRVHFDPAVLDAANAGSAFAVQEIAITALHEVGHLIGFAHGSPTWDPEGREYYTERPFSRMNPGENSCVPR